MVSKRDLAISYLFGTGLGLVVSLVGYLLLVDSAADVFSLGTVTALGFAGSLPYLGYWLRRSDLEDSAVWAIARWCGVGLAIPTAFAVTLMVLGIRPQLVLEFPHLLVNLVAVGASAGAVFGLVVELRRQQSRAEALNRRNSILNHIMRHDIRNDVGVIRGYADLLAERVDPDDQELLRPIENKSEQIVETSELARQIQSIEDDPDRKPVDVVATVVGYVSEARDTYPEATISTDLPEEAWVEAGDLFRTALSNLVENAIEHHDRSPSVTIQVADAATGSVTVRVLDDGPGVPREVREALFRHENGPSEGRPGLGLWLVKGVVDGYGGELSIRDREPRGTVAEIDLPAATRPVENAATA